MELSWLSSVEAGVIHVTFNDDVSEDLINLHHYETPFKVMPELVRDYFASRRARTSHK
ncbi:hypothetical protein [Paenibacillus lignilyticus]|uniref:KTSC domain-containing protein n=1 Tax=Paenibacillus lignilyticus TaxID=1172615 RepID=A0ABS5C6Y0_9BACL|nr:hypothetical protein [Paenibacillus lignilyticus]MBP3961605.1 hypothetical protein [Paenibacillus lignilyticus]MBP3963725.1 hypothetical protein [Paenibacillus lignilyticus]